VIATRGLGGRVRVWVLRGQQDSSLRLASICLQNYIHLLIAVSTLTTMAEEGCEKSIFHLCCSDPLPSIPGREVVLNKHGIDVELWSGSSIL